MRYGGLGIHPFNCDRSNAKCINCSKKAMLVNPLSDDLLFKIGTGVVSAMLTLVGTIVGLTRYLDAKYLRDIAKLEAQQLAYQERTDKKIELLEEAERKCMEEKSLLIGRVTTLEHIAKLRQNHE